MPSGPSSTKTDDPSAFLARAASDLFIPGLTDCARWCGAWCREVCGVDPTARFRYRTTTGYRRILKREGGLEALTRRVMDEAGFPLLTASRPGAIVLVDVRGVGPTLGIVARTGRAVFKGWPQGIVIAPEGRTLAIWSPSCLR